MAVNEPAPTYEGTLTHHGLSDEDMREECTEEFLFSLAKKMVRWQCVDLGVERSVVAGIENDRTMEDEGKRRQLLERWKEKFGHEATYGRLARSFILSDMANMADYVCKERKKMLTLQSSAVTSDTQVGGRGTTTVIDCKKSSPKGTNILKSFQAPHGEQSAATRDIAATMNPEQFTESAAQSDLTHRSSRGSISTVPQEEYHEDSSSHLVLGNKSSSASSIAPPSPVTAEHNGPIWTTITNMSSSVTALTSLLYSEKSEKKNILERKREKEGELNKRREQVEKDMKDKEEEIKMLEKKKRGMQSKLKEQEEKQKESKEELKEKEVEIAALKQSLRQKDGEEKEKRKLLKEARNDLKKEKQNVTAATEKIRELKAEVEKARNELTISREQRQKFSTLLMSTDSDLKYYREMRDKIKQKIKRRNQYTRYVIIILLAIIFALLGILCIMYV